MHGACAHKPSFYLCVSQRQRREVQGVAEIIGADEILALGPVVAPKGER